MLLEQGLANCSSAFQSAHAGSDVGRTAVDRVDHLDRPELLPAQHRRWCRRRPATEPGGLTPVEGRPLGATATVASGCGLDRPTPRPPAAALALWRARTGSASLAAGCGCRT